MCHAIAVILHSCCHRSLLQVLSPSQVAPDLKILRQTVLHAELLNLASSWSNFAACIDSTTSRMHVTNVYHGNALHAVL